MSLRVSDLIRRYGDIHHLLANLDGGLLRRIEGIASARALAANEGVARANEAVDGLYLLVDGGLRVHSLSGEGKQHLAGILGPGDVFGIIPVMDDKPSLHYADTTAPTTVVFLPAAAFRALVYSSPRLTENVIKLLCQRGRLAFAINDRFGLTATPYRVARCLADISSYFAESEIVGLELELEINQYELSSMLAISRQSVSRELKELERQDLVTVGYNRIRVNDLERLHALFD